MQIPEFDRRDKDELLRLIGTRAASYTPEWRFDQEQPDVGTGLALIYTELFGQTVKRFNQVAEKNTAAFFSHIGTGLLPAVPAEGYVCFSLAPSAETGAEIRTGTSLLADAPLEENGSTVFSVMDDLYVTPASPTAIYTVNGRLDRIVKNYDQQSFSGEAFPLFHLNGENLQAHRCMLRQDELLLLSGGGVLELTLTPSHQRELSREIWEVLNDPEKVQWEYCYRDSWQPFVDCQAEGNHVTLKLREYQFPITGRMQDGVDEGRWIRFSLKDGVQLPPFSLRQIRLAARNRNLLPDLIHASGADQNVHEFLPFGEQLGLFAEAYFSCREALIKRGSEIEMTFNVDFIPIPVDYSAGETPINWKLVMKKTDFKLDEEYDINIQEVLWEYFNGSGWARIFPDSRHADCFTASKTAKGQFRSIRFHCPEDIRPVLVNSEIGYFIRARVLKVKNLYKLKGNYIIPLIEGMRFSYHYAERGRLPEEIVTVNNREEVRLDTGTLLDINTVFSPFSYLQENPSALYFAFGAPPVGGPVKMLFFLAETMREKPARLIWEYRTENGWESLNAVDGTENLRQTGILTLLVGKGMAKSRFWGQDAYWIRATDGEGRYEGDKRQPLPRVTGLHMNAARIRNTETQPPEYFFIEPEQKQFTCNLLRQKVFEAEVWVNEQEVLLPGEIAALQKAGRLLEVRDAAGIVTESWVRWEECDDFTLSSSQDRHYVLLRNEGKIQFSDGVNGKIPPSGIRETIQVLYSTGGGTSGNVAVGAVNRSARSLGIVNGIRNPAPTANGCDQETFQDAVTRAAAALRHGSRAVTAKDFEALALEATRNIVRAHCFPNRDSQGEHSPGSVTMAVVLGQHAVGADFFRGVSDQVMGYISSRCGGNLTALERFSVVQPCFLELCVKVELAVDSFEDVFPVREEINRRLTAFLNPLTGNFDGRGWAIGRIPNSTQIRNSLSGIKGISFLKTVTVSIFTESGFGKVETSLEQLKNRIFALPQSGEHEMIIAVER